MKVRYVFPLTQPMKVEDHWPVPLLGGQCRLIETDGLVTAVEFTKTGLPVDYAFAVTETPDQKSKLTITGKDDFLSMVRDHIQRAFSFLQCHFDTGISVEELDVHHEPEGEAEKVEIPSFHFGKGEPPPLPLSYDLFTRALMAAEDHEGPDFVSSLASMAREALIAKRYIDAFRFSFLLIESIHGGGKFKSYQLKKEFLASKDLCAAIVDSIADWKTQLVSAKSATLDLMNGGPTVQQVIDHIVDMRGHYFHGNLAKKDAWNPAKQQEAEALAVLGVALAQTIASEASQPMFADEYAKRHFDEAGLVGAHVIMKITYRFRVPEDELIHTQQANFNMPGTKPTTAMAMEAAWRAIHNFQQQLPVGRLHSVTGKSPTDDADVFEVRFLTEKDGKVVED